MTTNDTDTVAGIIEKRLLDLLAAQNKNAPMWGLTLYCTGDFYDARWKKAFTIRAPTAVEALTLMLIQERENLPAVEVLESLVVHVEQLTSRT